MMESGVTPCFLVHTCCEGKLMYRCFVYLCYATGMELMSVGFGTENIITKTTSTGIFNVCVVLSALPTYVAEFARDGIR